MNIFDFYIQNKKIILINNEINFNSFEMYFKKELRFIRNVFKITNLLHT